MDVTPTLLEFAGIPLTDGSFQGRAVEPLRGRSWVPYLKGRREYVYGPDDAIGTEVFGSRSLRQGDWKITDTGNGAWRLFDVARDPGETHDLAAEMPDRLKQLEAAWGSYARDVGVVAPPMAVLPQP
ncbi:hypothetical protein SOJ00_20510 [Pseudomonas paraeruginosa]|nr:hypothetical protein [Pseudomonas paraeruginosa]MDY1576900.1 hypothetical protein [Pseudomonas paraeruginosa]